MYRTIKKDLIAWKQSINKKPLIIDGARQVGKTYIIREFGNEEYKNVIEINFQFNVDARRYFEKPRSFEEIMDYIYINNISIDINSPKDTLLFFDEIQLVPELITELKVLKEKCPFDVICSGSILGITLNKMSSFPVGYVETITMYPMSFKEFLYALGYDDRFLTIIKNNIVSKTTISDAIHNKMNELFNIYLVVGGLPEAVLVYVNTKLISESIKVLRRLNSDYRSDIATYGGSDIKIKAIECFDSLPLQLSKDNKKFQYKLVKEGYNARYYDSSLEWLNNSGLVIKTNRLKSIGDPLAIYKEMAIFKIYFFDTGLLIANFDDSIIQKVLDDALEIYNGVIYENIASIILNQYGYEQYYYEPNTSSEIDFITYYKGNITPIEIKSGLHTRSTSFNKFIEEYKSEFSFRFSKKNVGYDTKTRSWHLPIYTMPLIFEEKLI